MNAGIDYAGPGSTVNRNAETGIRYGVISQNEVLQAWADSFEPDYGRPDEAIACPECGDMITVAGHDWGDEAICPKCGETITIEFPDCAEPLGFTLDDGEYQAQCGDDGDIFIISSPYFTLCRFCSPCAPGAGYLMSPDPDGIKTYCFGHDFFDDGKAPYPVYRVDTGEEIFREVNGGNKP